MNLNETAIDQLFEMNTTVCEQLDEVVRVVFMLHEVARIPRDVDNIEPVIFVPVGILLLSLIFLFFGRLFVRLTAGVAAMCAAFFLLYTSPALQEWPCATRTLVSAAAGFLSGILTAFLIKLGIFVIGAAAIAAIVHVMFATFPELHELGNQPKFWELSVGYWICMAIAIVCGGVAVRWHTKAILEVLTAGIGGLGVTYSLYSMNIIANLQMTRWVFVGTGVVGVCLGVFVQRRNRLKKKRPVQAQKKQHVNGNNVAIT